MAYDETLATRVRGLIGDLPGVTEKKMFGALVFFLRGNMSCGVYGDGLIVRMSPDDSAAALAEPGARVPEMGGRPMKNWVQVEPDHLADDGDLDGWVQRGVAYAGTLPAK
ncbi:YjbR protein [Actinokineospora alba]|uniref:YjbR protein n=1 Tax=Actinokineospora alba TaxID=504798 RepID=A0A1H0VJQ8_9PSEU|nr:TfoX/Sxy family protein [Actinokineospora alba]TDP67690.1 YjbR protein [Actinokineospora alba]SDJ28319.1 YjbR protein [Actinokineospora alba]SDP78435.1 YjbR protein [Actinokineospora alba]